jgi:Mg2+-importing ATPase
MRFPNRRAPTTRTTWQSLDLYTSAQLDVPDVLTRLSAPEGGLTEDEAARRLHELGPNAIRSHGAHPIDVLVRQLRSPLLVLLLVAAAIALVVGERTDGLIIISIMALSTCLGFVNEFRAERAVEALHSRIRHSATVLRAGRVVGVDVTELVPGDLVGLDVGDVVPADLRLLEVSGLACDEAVLTGEAIPA